MIYIYIYYIIVEKFPDMELKIVQYSNHRNLVKNYHRERNKKVF